ncbi:alpha/beta hydrolase [Photobacterium halotolerans]|uniref:alpha/beta hydrolase n=1 Tax=Photobacterium halotolerans TaxID=265726 RepID=UPI0013732B9B|nr:alpha/beta hydrolase [Photobacterium halotolerans]NAW86245.1 alpha/beta hydrolase fold domain-containing protein [Photobacterium halotolerans]NAX45970.1 alpha/beta hydrolase fold domain-containing protein [Photobacterium halotolerans]
MVKLDNGLKIWLDAYHQGLTQLMQSGYVATVEAIRDGLSNLTATCVTDSPHIARVLDTCVAEHTQAVPVRIYHPAPDRPLPVIVFLHGGGHMAGSVAVYDPICRKLSKTTQHIVVSVDYRLAPEWPYPNGLSDASIVIEQIWPLLEQQKLAYLPTLTLIGDSGGGAMVATLSADYQDHPDVSIDNQVLIYPSLDYTMSRPSVAANGKGLFLQQDKMQWYFDQYFQHGEDRQAASPLFMAKSGRMPRTLMITAEFCPLRDEGVAYVQQLSALGVDTEHFHLDDMIHAYLNLESLVPGQCGATYQKIADFLTT